MTKRLMAAFLAMLLLFAAGCAQTTPGPSAPERTEKPAEQAAESDPAPEQTTDVPEWIVSDLMGSVTAETQVDLKDDFHAAVNQDWLSTAEISPAYGQAGSFAERTQEVTGQILTLMVDPSLESHEAKLVQTLFAQYVDMDTRNALGVEPMIPYIQETMAIETLDDVTEHVLDVQNNLSSSFTQITVGADYKDSTKNVAMISSPTYVMDADEYRSITSVGEKTKAAYDVMNVKLLMRTGMSKEEAQQISDDFFEMERRMAEASLGTSDSIAPDFRERIYNPVSIDELRELSPNYPIVDILKPYIDAGVDRFILADTGWLERMNELYAEENVELLRAYLLRSQVMSMSALLDQECLNIIYEAQSAIAGVNITADAATTAYSVCSTLLKMAVGKLYAESFVTPEIKEDVTDIVHESLAVYRERLENSTWLTAETREKAVEKLDNIKVRVAYPDDWSLYDYSDLTLKTIEEGGSLMDSYMAVLTHSFDAKIAQAVSPIDANLWYYAAPQDVNAFYVANDNSINIPAGILGGCFYDPSASHEVNMGTIGMVIGHEITHAFDTTGSQFDKDGNMQSWWTEEDSIAFAERTAAVSEYFGRFEALPGVFVNGELTIGETVADLGGLSCMLEIATGMDDFAYEDFFESYARLWRKQLPETTLETVVRTDAHPPGYLRTNAIVQQFQEFYDTYGIEEGDGMYLPLEERLAVW